MSAVVSSYRFLGAVCHVLADGTILSVQDGWVLHTSGDRTTVLGVYSDLADYNASAPRTAVRWQACLDEVDA